MKMDDFKKLIEEREKADAQQADLPKEVYAHCRRCGTALADVDVHRILGKPYCISCADIFLEGENP